VHAEPPDDSALDPVGDPVGNPDDTRLNDSPLYQLAVLQSARSSGDIVLERVTRKRLAELGCRIVFTEPLPQAKPRAKKARS
jgi:hypothetical protein